jgi:hypothetical protein
VLLIIVLRANPRILLWSTKEALRCLVAQLASMSNEIDKELFTSASIHAMYPLLLQLDANRGAISGATIGEGDTWRGCQLIYVYSSPSIFI